MFHHHAHYHFILSNREALVAALTSISSKQQEPLPPGEKTSEAHEETRPAVSPQPAAPVTPTASVVPAWKPTILVVDDSSMNRKVDAARKLPIVGYQPPLSLSPPPITLLHTPAFPFT